jgi:hypothetical protein
MSKCHICPLGLIPVGCTAPLRFVELSPTFRAPDALRCNRDETGSRAVWEGPAPDLPFRPVPARLARAGPAAQRTVPGVRMSRSPVRRMDSQRLGEQDWLSTGSGRGHPAGRSNDQVGRGTASYRVSTCAFRLGVLSSGRHCAELSPSFLALAGPTCGERKL